MTTLIITCFTVSLFTQLLIDFKPTVFATDHVDEVITSSYFFNYLRSLSIEHTIDVTSSLSVVSQCCHDNTAVHLCLFRRRKSPRIST